MKTILALFIAFAGSTAFAKPEVRCGWIENPTPANYWIIDADGEWTISVQGGYQAEGDVVFPRDGANNYVKTNFNYGYFCGCINATVDKADRKVLKIFSASAKSLSACLNDPALPQDYRPRTLVHSSGKAYTECQDEAELQVGFKDRQACVNQRGEYYFLAE